MGFLKNLLGLGVAAGTAYAAVKVAQKYNEKKNANADLNGDGAVDAKDTVYGVKEAAREVYAETAAKVREIDPRLTIHDFRMVKGNDHTNLIFDVVVPQGFGMKASRLKEVIAQALRRDDPNHFAVVTVDYSYASAPPEKG